MNQIDQQKITITFSTLLYCAFITIIVFIGISTLGFLIGAPFAIFSHGGLSVIFFYLIALPFFIYVSFFLIMPTVIRSLRERGIENAEKVTYFTLFFLIDLLVLLSRWNLWKLFPGLNKASESWHFVFTGYLLLIIGVIMLGYYFSFLLFNRWKQYFIVYIITTILGLLTIFTFIYQ
ncbi:MAG TPA: hypothetical protein VLF93_04730 [Candidatus Saccharimonadales bacterium]|nr:hypothetical protein [Candidatus Saccharimonadales bacterium]